MSDIQILTINRKKFVLLPYKQYQKLLSQIEDLKDLGAIKRRAGQPRISFGQVKQKYLKG